MQQSRGDTKNVFQYLLSSSIVKLSAMYSFYCAVYTLFKRVKSTLYTSRYLTAISQYHFAENCFLCYNLFSNRTLSLRSSLKKLPSTPKASSSILMRSICIIVCWSHHQPSDTINKSFSTPPCWSSSPLYYKGIQ